MLKTRLFAWTRQTTRLFHQKNFEGKQDTFYFKKSSLPSSSEKTPVSLVLGWAGSSDSNVSKYADIYTDLGYHVVRFAPSFKWTFLQTSSHVRFADNLLNQLKNEYNLQNNPILVHTFSNAGAFLFSHMYEKSCANKEYSFLRQNLRAHIYDSGPGFELNSENYSKFLDTAYKLGNKALGNNLLSYTLTTGLMIYMFFRHMLFIRGKNYFNQRISFLRDADLKIPLLIFYSKIDRLVWYKAVEEFIQAKRDLGVDVKEICFNDVEHCMHFVKYKEEYLKELKEYLARNSLPN